MNLNELVDFHDKHKNCAIDAVIMQKDAAYAERNQLVAALTKLFPASLERDPHVKDGEEWGWIVFVDLPTGQASWHIHDSELPLFEHLPRNVGRRWDGHTTEEKYLRLAKLPLAHTVLSAPRVTLQQMIDAGLNGFGIQLFVESYRRFKDWRTAGPLTFACKGVKITVSPDPDGAGPNRYDEGNIAGAPDDFNRT